MSQQAVGFLIDRLLTDEKLRDQFACNRLGTLVDLQLLGLELTPDEIDAFAQTDPRTWLSSDQRFGGRVH